VPPVKFITPQFLTAVFLWASFPVAGTVIAMLTARARSKGTMAVAPFTQALYCPSVARTPKGP